MNGITAFPNAEAVGTTTNGSRIGRTPPKNGDAPLRREATDAGRPGSIPSTLAYDGDIVPTFRVTEKGIERSGPRRATNPLSRVAVSLFLIGDGERHPTPVAPLPHHAP